MIPDTRDLEAFLAVCDARGFRRAAERLGISQPAVSHRIRGLERQLGTALFEHPRRRVIPTAAGEALQEFCSRFFTELSALAGVAGAVTWGPTEPLRIACPGAFGRFVVFPILRSAAFRDASLRLLFRAPEKVYELVESGQCELGFTYAPRVTRTLDLREAFVESFVLVAPPDHALQAGAAFDAVVAHPFVTYEECDYVFGRWFGDAFGRQPQVLHGPSHFERLEEVIAMVSDGRGLSIVPEHAVRAAALEGRVKILEEGWPACRNMEYAVTRPGRVMRPEIATLLAELSEESAARNAAAPSG